MLPFKESDTADPGCACSLVSLLLAGARVESPLDQCRLFQLALSGRTIELARPLSVITINPPA
jgi:hypothetical protein